MVLWEGIFGILQFCISARCPDRCKEIEDKELFCSRTGRKQFNSNNPHTRRHIHAGTQDNERYGGGHSHGQLVMKLGIRIQIKTEVALQILSRDNNQW